MSINHSRDAQTRGQAGANQVATSQDGELFPTVRSGAFNLRRSQNVFMNRSHRVQVFNSSTLPSDGLYHAGSFTDVRIQAADPLTSMVLRITITNNDAKNSMVLTPEGVLNFVDHWDILGNNGSQLLERIGSDHNMLAFAENSPDSYQKYRSALIGGGNPAGGYTILPAGSVTVYLPIFRSILCDQELMSAGLLGALVVRTWWRGPTWINQAEAITATSLTISAFDMVCQTTLYDPSRSQAMISRYMTGPRTDIRYAVPSTVSTDH
jgi:hypothetical protein